ncbi:MAG: hypothetical protein ACXW3V_02965 [Methylocystis sp.]
MLKSHLICSAAICAFVFATVAAQAEPLPSLGCYARAYDTAHLSAHKKQIVDKTWLSIETRKDTPPYPFSATLQFSTKGRGKGLEQKGVVLRIIGAQIEIAGAPARIGPRHFQPLDDRHEHTLGLRGDPEGAGLTVADPAMMHAVVLGLAEVGFLG